MNITWAENEVKLAIQKEKEMAEGTDKWKYGAACYRSALRAYKEICKIGHYGFSANMAIKIFNNLIDGKPLTSIEDTPDIWVDVSETLHGSTYKNVYRCTRLPTLLKCVKQDETVIIMDTDRLRCSLIDNPSEAFSWTFANRIFSKICPIQFPYTPPPTPYKMVQDEFLADPKNGDVDTIGFLYYLTPIGDRVDVNLYFKEEDGKMVPIDKDEFEERKAKRVDKE